MEVYSSCVREGETGLLVDNDAEAWRAALDRLIEGAELRERIRRSAREEVQRRYSQERAASEWLGEIRRSSTRPKSGCVLPPRFPHLAHRRGSGRPSSIASAG